MWCFAGDFCENDCAGRGFLRGKRGEVVVICVAKRESKSALKNGTAFFYEMRFIWLPRRDAANSQPGAKPEGATVKE
jgi:hypothetical protein